MADDWDDRRRESNDYLNRRDDQLRFEETQAKRTKAVYDAIHDEDDLRLYLELGITPPDSSDVDLDDLSDYDEENRTPTAQEQFAEHSSSLRVALQFSQALPSYLTQEWINKIREIDIYKPSQGLQILDELLEGYEWASERFKPQRDIFNLAITETMRFDEEMREIKHELDWLRAILKHVEDYLNR
jgi:hypothetical protein